MAVPVTVPITQNYLLNLEERYIVVALTFSIARKTFPLHVKRFRDITEIHKPDLQKELFN